MRPASATLFFLLLCMSGGSLVRACPGAVPPVINVTIREDKPSLETKYTAEELARHAHEAGIPEKNIAGLTENTIKLDHQENFMQWSNNEQDIGCLWLKSIDVQLNSAPDILVAQEYGNHPCQFRGTFSHESAHVQTDRDLLKKYILQMNEGLKMAYAANQDSGLVPYSDLPQAREKMEGEVGATLDVLFEKMVKDRREIQQDLENPWEYWTVMGCERQPGE
jgi:hypothetical protein